jgi:hypothetical protein
MPECVTSRQRGSERVLSLEDIFFSHEFGRARGLTTVVTTADEATSSVGPSQPGVSPGIGSLPASLRLPG